MLKTALGASQYLKVEGLDILLGEDLRGTEVLGCGLGRDVALGSWGVGFPSVKSASCFMSFLHGFI